MILKTALDAYTIFLNSFSLLLLLFNLSLCLNYIHFTQHNLQNTNNRTIGLII